MAANDRYTVAVSTPFATGEGTYVPQGRLVVTQEHVVRDSATVVVDPEGPNEQLAEVVYLDDTHDLAFLRCGRVPELAGPPPLEDTTQVLLNAFNEGNGRRAAWCPSCARMIFEGIPVPAECTDCEGSLTFPGAVREVEPTGVAATIEAVITAADYDRRLARRGPNLWRIRRGSAAIQITYHPDSGLVTGDAYLCRLPEIPDAELFAFLLRENDRLQQLTFSTYGRDIILSFLIYDRYLEVDTALPRFQRLFERADYYDDVLVEGFGAGW